MATIIIKGTSPAYKFRSIGVYLDGQKMGKVSPGTTERFEADPGRHRLHLRTAFIQSEPVEFDLVDQARFEIGVNSLMVAIPPVILFVSLIGYILASANRLYISRWIPLAGIVLYITLLLTTVRRHIFIRYLIPDQN